MSEIYIVGMGPGDKDNITYRAKEVLEKVDVVVGYKTYIELAQSICDLKETISSGMRHEVERCEKVLSLVEENKTVALVSSGDSGIYGMAGIMLEVLKAHNSKCKVEVVPGVTSASASAALLGAPIIHDCAFISLSDLLTQWDLIKKRIKNAADGDFVICLYNPKSKKRITQLSEAVAIIKEYRTLDTPVGIVKNAMRETQEVILTDLDNLLSQDVDMTTTIIIGNSQSYKTEEFMITPRGYSL